jgi:NAD(P)-dependent dehydrogenase (short-subunit alcohol dehydrogenase family)
MIRVSHFPEHGMQRHVAGLAAILALTALRAIAAPADEPQQPPAAPPAAAPDSHAPAARTPAVLITGTNRGLGLALATLYARRGWRVIAAAREPEQAADLQAVAQKYPNVTVEQLDVAKNEQIAALAQKYQGQPIDVLINNAGLLGERDKQSFSQTLDYATFEDMLRVNSYAPLLVSQAFLRNVLLGDQKKIVAITSALASITDAARFGGLPFYRMSKAALNMGMRTLQAEVRSRGVRVGILSPAAVETRMLRQSAFNGEGMVPAASAAAIIKNIDALGDAEARFIQYNGAILPW